MKQLLVLTFAGVLVFGAGSAAATGPSFRCDGHLTVPEHAICRDTTLSKLDRVMARYYHASREIASRRERAQLHAAQRIWLRWRDTCGGDPSCLERRYEQRIIDLAPFGRLPPGFGCQAGSLLETGALLPERRLSDSY